MSNAHFSYIFDENKAPIPMSYNHVRVLRILSHHPRYREQIRSIAMTLAGHHIHTGTLTPVLKKLEQWNFILRTNPNVSRSAGYQFCITNEGLRALEAFDSVEKQMALTASSFA